MGWTGTGYTLWKWYVVFLHSLVVAMERTTVHDMSVKVLMSTSDSIWSIIYNAIRSEWNGMVKIISATSYDTLRVTILHPPRGINNIIKPTKRNYKISCTTKHQSERNSRFPRSNQATPTRVIADVHLGEVRNVQKDKKHMRSILASEIE